MTNFQGTVGDDTITGTVGADNFTYLGGRDTYGGGSGDDVFTASGLDIPDGGRLVANGSTGSDRLDFRAFVSMDVVFNGGTGDDEAFIIFGAANARFLLRMGDGDDFVSIGKAYYGADFRVSGVFDIDLGTGHDVVELGEIREGSLTISNFTAGVGGDVLRFVDLLHFTSWDQSTNLFATGHLTLQQAGSDTLLTMRQDGPDTEGIDIRLVGVDASALTVGNFDGLPPDGSAVAGETIQGTSGADTLEGTFGDDVIHGHGNSDDISGGVGDDLIYGGDAHDTLRAGLGNDRVFGEAGDDYFSYMGGNDQYSGGSGDDRFNVSNSDIVDGGSVFINAGTGADRLRFSAFVDMAVTFNAGAGDDEAFVIFGDENARFTFDMGAGDDYVGVGATNYGSTFRVSGAFDLTLGDGRDTVEVREIGISAYSLILPLPNFSLAISDFEAGADGDVFVMNFAEFIGNWDGVANPFATGAARLMQSGADTVVQFENFAVESYGRTAEATAWTTIATFENIRANNFHADNFTGWQPNLAGSSGNDVIHGTRGRDVVFGGDGADRMVGYAGEDRLDGGAGDDIINGGAHRDRIEGGNGNDRLFGDNGDDWFDGGAGADRIDAGDGHDTAHGGAGDDLLVMRSGDDRAFGGEGNDGLHGQNGDDQLYGQQGADTLRGGAGHDALFGGAGNDVLLGESGNDTLDGGDGDDILSGANGVDSLFGGHGDDRLNGGAHDDQLDGGSGADILNGAAGRDALAGGTGNDTLIGGDGEDTLDGGAGFNIVYGGRDADVFHRTGSGTDFIKDFTLGEDRVALDDSLSDFDDLLAHAQDTASGLRIVNGDAGVYVLAGITLSDVTAEDFMFADDAIA